MPRPPRDLSARLARYAADVAIATTFLLRGLTHFVAPEAAEQRSLLARSLPPWDSIWCVLWLAGPILIATGAARDRPELVAMGWTVLGCGMALNLVAIVGLHWDDPRSYISIPFLLLGAWRLAQLDALPAFLRRLLPTRER